MNRKLLSFVRFSTQSTKAKISYLQEILGYCGYNINVIGKRDRELVKIITSIQRDNNITPNGLVDVKTYNVIINKYNNCHKSNRKDISYDNYSRV